jgi:hypothetical protein
VAHVARQNRVRRAGIVSGAERRDELRSAIHLQEPRGVSHSPARPTRDGSEGQGMKKPVRLPCHSGPTNPNMPRCLGSRDVRAGSPQGITPPGLPRIRTCPLGHTARHVMSSLQGGTLSGSQPVVGADTAPTVGRMYPREWSPDGDAARAISSRCRPQTIGIESEQRSCL